jgi:plastocyanin
MRNRTRILCFLAATVAAAPLVWASPAPAGGAVIQAHGENRGPGGGDHAHADDDDDDDDDVAATAASAVPPGQGGAQSAVSATNGPATVSIVDGGFQPAALTLAAGSQVTWINTDSSRHTATADGDAFDSGSLNQGGTFSFAFANPGTFAYVCAFHSDMRGTVTVGGAAPAVPAPPAPPTTAAASPPPTTTITGAGAPASVEIQDHEFSPARLIVGRGTEVTWRNMGQAPHTVTGDGFDSAEMAATQSFAYRFAAPGTYDYRCALHPRMRGVVEVVADATTTPVAGEVGGFPIERVAAGGIVGAPILLLVGAVFFWGRR